jgi:hypothetical protein
MKLSAPFIGVLLLCCTSAKSNDTLQTRVPDSLTLAQAYINLSLTEQYFDTLAIGRLSKILRYEEGELKSIKDSNFVSANKHLFYSSSSLLNYNKAHLMFKTKTSVARSVLTKWRNTLDRSIDDFNTAGLNQYFSLLENRPEEQSEAIVYNDLIGFSKELSSTLINDVYNLKSAFNPYFNADIYPDFRRIFYWAVKSRKNPLDSLRQVASIYNMGVDGSIIDGRPETRGRRLRVPNNFRLDKDYVIDLPNQLISRYLQLNYLATGKHNKTLGQDERSSLHDSYDNFKRDVEEYYNSSSPDSFFRRNINNETLKILSDNIQKRYPNDLRLQDQAAMMMMPRPSAPNLPRFYFPDPAPFPSAYTFVTNFQPALKSMKQVDNYLSTIFNRAGYRRRLHYYYVRTGFAVTTSLEKINKDGSPVSDNKRWEVSSGSGSFSFYQVFKSIFFETESNFRMFALIVSPRKVGLQSSAASIGGMQDLTEHSYPSLPQDLEAMTIDSKTLSVLVYHFLQSDVGEVPMLQTKNALPVINHLQKSGLVDIVANQ